MLLTIDIGTSNFKAAIWDFEGNKIASAAMPLSINMSDGTGDSPRHEADSGQWLKAFEDCCRRLRCTSSGAHVPLSAVEAVVISGNGPSLTPVFAAPEFAANGLKVPTAPARLWLDRRAVVAAEQVSAVAGGFVDASFYLPKALDIKINEPHVYEKTACFLGCPELLAFALSGEARTVFPSDGFERWFWNDSILERLDLDKEKFPPFIRPGEVFGALAPRIATNFGFKPNIPIISGGPDFFAAILGAGVVQPGQTCDRAGTSEGINACTHNRIADERLMSYKHPVQPFWNVSGIISTTGKAIEWGRDLLGLKTHEEFCALAETSQAGAGGMVCVPCLAGERGNPAARGVLRGLSLAAGRAEFARAVLEGIGFAIRGIIGIMEEAGATVDELRIAGSLSCSNILNQIKADITHKPVLVPRHKEAELLGLAIIGACTLGKFASFAEAANALVHIEKTFQPDTHNSALYDNLFEEYRKVKGD